MQLCLPPSRHAQAMLWKEEVCFDLTRQTCLTSWPSNKSSHDTGESLTLKFSIVAAHCTAPDLACFLGVQPAALGHPSKPPDEVDKPFHIRHLSEYLLSRPKWTKEEEDFVKEHYQKPAAIIAMLGEKHKKLQDRNDVGPSPL